MYYQFFTIKLQVDKEVTILRIINKTCLAAWSYCVEMDLIPKNTFSSLQYTVANSLHVLNTLKDDETMETESENEIASKQNLRR